MGFWDERYSGTDFYYGKNPNIFIAECILNHPKKARILFPAEGEGRNAVFAASEGWDVDAFDSSNEAKKKAEKLSLEFKTSINYFLANLFDFTPQPAEYDVIALSFVHMPPEFRTIVHRNLISGLKNGGMIFLEAYSKNQIFYQTGGPADESLLFRPDDLKMDFGDLEIISLREQLTFLSEGRHFGKSSVVRLIAKRIFSE